MNAKQLRTEIIRPALVAVGLYSKPAEDIVFGTACVESNMGRLFYKYGRDYEF